MPGLEVELVEAAVELVDADSLFVPVDGKLCKLDSETTIAMRAALHSDERVDEMESVEDQLARLRPLAHPEARAIEGVGAWTKLIVSAAYPHQDGHGSAAGDCARLVSTALPVAIALVEQLDLRSMAATSIFSAYRLSPEQSIRAFAAGLAAAAHHHVLVRWSLPDADERALALKVLGSGSSGLRIRRE